MLKAIAVTILGRKNTAHAECPKRVLARREIESLFHDDLEAHAFTLKSARKANPSHA